jgi:hypothetical protein
MLTHVYVSVSMCDMWCGYVHLVMQRPGVLVLNILSNKCPFSKKKCDMWYVQKRQ